MTANETLSDPSALALEIVGISKRFGGAQALDNVNFSVRQGEVVGLLGHNGSGKSTLIKCLAGYHKPDSIEELRICGESLNEQDSHRVVGTHIGFVHQDLGLIPDLSVLDNMMLASLRDERAAMIDWSAQSRRASKALAEFGLHFALSTPVSKLEQAERCLLAVVRAIDSLGTTGESLRGKILILDEPTPFLPASGVKKLFTLMRKFVATGGSIIFVAHDIDEVLEVTDRITVLRNGRNSADFVTSQASHEQIVEAIIGGKISVVEPDPLQVTQSSGEHNITGLSGGEVKHLSFKVGRGEIIGITGLAGSGASLVPELLSGAAPALGGTLSMDDGTRIALAGSSVSKQMSKGICLLPDDRLNKSAAGALLLSENLALPFLPAFFRHGFLDWTAIRTSTTSTAQRAGVLPANSDLPFSAYSGGNQQKALVAKWLSMAPQLFLVSEPTQGVDIGAKSAIYDAIRTAAARGMATICYSSDAAELARICDRVLVLAKGRVVAELTGPTLTKDSISKACLEAGDSLSSSGVHTDFDSANPLQHSLSTEI